MRHSIATVSLAGTLEEKLRVIAGRGSTAWKSSRPTSSAPSSPRRRFAAGPRTSAWPCCAGGAADLSFAAPGGTGIIFCATEEGDRMSMVGDGDGFVLAASHQQALAGIEDIDHVALSQPFELFDQAALFYRSVLGLAAEATEELAGPEGLTRSRALSDPGGQLRLVLNVPLLGDTAVGHPAGLQHVAFRCGDVLVAAEVLRRRGVPVLAIPENYYEDLSARFELDPAFAEKLRNLNVLYDRSPDGSFLHFYTALIGGCFFFELVQRTGSYGGYGAANSLIRRAAQAALATAGSES